MSAARAYRTRTIKRDRRTAARVAQLDEQILAVLYVDHPQSVRHVFYRMTDPRLPEPVEKSERGYRHVQHRCKELRREGRLAYGWISDATRRGYHTVTYRDAADFVQRMAGTYRADLWSMSDSYIEVWCESRSIAGVLEHDCRDLAVSLYPCGGFSSITLAYEAAEYINEAAEWRDVVIYYVGDYDRAGILIDVALERELRQHLDPDIDMSFRRIAITESQIAEFDLPTKPCNVTDRRACHVTVTVEAEAMPAAALRTLLRGCVESHLNVNSLHAAKVAEESERAGLRRIADIMAGAA